MKLPSLLPQELHYVQVVETPLQLLNLLVQHPPDLIAFVHNASLDETWCLNHKEEMRFLLKWLTEQAFYDHILHEEVVRIIQTIRTHYKILLPLVPNDIICEIDNVKDACNSMLLGGSSDLILELIRLECRLKEKKTLALEGMTPEFFTYLIEYSTTGSVKDLWREGKNGIIKVLSEATRWEVPGLIYICENLLKVYLDKSNALVAWKQAKKLGWSIICQAVIDLYNSEEKGYKLAFDGTSFTFTFVSFGREAMERLEEFRVYITHLVMRKTLSEEAPFSDVLLSFPKLIGLDLSDSRIFSDRFRDIPEKLQELNLSKCSWLTAETFPKIVMICPNLTCLVLASNVQLDYSAWSVLHKFRRLEKLDLSRCHQVGSEELVTILQSCQALKELSLAECMQITEKGFYEIARTITDIEALDLSRTSITKEPLIEIAVSCGKLRQLNLTRCSNLSDLFLKKFISQYPNLRNK